MKSMEKLADSSLKEVLARKALQALQGRGCRGPAALALRVRFAHETTAAAFVFLRSETVGFP